MSFWDGHWSLLADVASPSSPDWITILLTWGPAGVVLAMVLLGIIEPKRVRVSLEKERDDWKTAFETERSAHQLTREALAAANARGDAALESSTTMTKLLESLGHLRAGG